MSPHDRDAPGTAVAQDGPSRSADVLVDCRDAALTFGRGANAVVAVHGATLRVRAGDRIAVVGPSGSGKSSLLHLLAGLETPTSGSVSWPAPPGPRGIGLVFQGDSLIPALDVAENTALPLVLTGLPDDQARRTALEALASVNAADLADRLPEEISGGQAQRVAAARVLAQAPSLILADEPTGRLDHGTGGHVLDALLTAADRTGAALVVTTHDPAVAARLSTRLTMRDGRLDFPRADPVDGPAEHGLARHLAPPQEES
ncbi:ABC transporter ATP-binding protein [Streptomyces sp. NPDC060187]|uniref:ABC transporter ATP-binding protein n=1 Tax=Streptomyces sp. NPDC060187 TaxID=3347067 RepID=UPI0036519C38